MVDTSRRNFFSFGSRPDAKDSPSSEASSPDTLNNGFTGMLSKPISRRTVLQSIPAVAAGSVLQPIALVEKTVENIAPVASAAAITAAKHLCDMFSTVWDITCSPIENPDDIFYNAALSARKHLEKGRFNASGLTSWVVSRSGAIKTVAGVLSRNTVQEEDIHVSLAEHLRRLSKIGEQLDNVGDPLNQHLSKALDVTYREVFETYGVLAPNVPDDAVPYGHYFSWLQKIPEHVLYNKDSAELHENFQIKLANMAASEAFQSVFGDKYRLSARQIRTALGRDDFWADDKPTPVMKQAAQWIAYVTKNFKHEKILAAQDKLDVFSGGSFEMSRQYRQIIEREVQKYSHVLDQMAGEDEKKPMPSEKEFNREVRKREMMENKEIRDRKFAAREEERREWQRVVHRGGTTAGNDIY